MSPSVLYHHLCDNEVCYKGTELYLHYLQVVEVGPGGNLLDSTHELNLMPGFNLEGFPNRDSTMYTSEYGIESARTCIRGTLRYKVNAMSTKLFVSHSCRTINGPQCKKTCLWGFANNTGPD